MNSKNFEEINKDVVYLKRECHNNILLLKLFINSIYYYKNYSLVLKLIIFPLNWGIVAIFLSHSYLNHNLFVVLSVISTLLILKSLLYASSIFTYQNNKSLKTRLFSFILSIRFLKNNTLGASFASISFYEKLFKDTKENIKNSKCLTEIELSILNEEIEIIQKRALEAQNESIKNLNKKFNPFLNNKKLKELSIDLKYNFQTPYLR